MTDETCNKDTNTISEYRKDFKAVLLINLGTPNSYKVRDIRKYLKEFLSDRRVIELPALIWQPILRFFILPIRAPRLAKIYQKIWFKSEKCSPLMYYARAQAKKLSMLFSHEEIIIDYAMRYGRPSIGEKIKSLSQKGVTDLKILPLYPQYAASTTASVFDEVFRVLKTMRCQPSITSILPYYQHVVYINALKKSVKHYLGVINFTPDILLLSFHGIPAYCVHKGDPYKKHCEKTYALLRDTLIKENLEVAMSFQSRFGRKEWLQPYTTELLADFPKLGKKNVLIIAPGFSADCLETLEELAETEYNTFMQAGGKNYAVIPCLNDSDIHIHMLKTLICEHL